MSLRTVQDGKRDKSASKSPSYRSPGANSGNNTDGSHEQRRPTKKVKTKSEALEKVVWTDSEGEDAGTAAYQTFKNKKSVARKQRAAVTRRVKAVDAQNQLAAPSHGPDLTGVGKTTKKPLGNNSILEREEVLSDEDIPDYVKDRRRTFNARVSKLKDAGLALPPSYEDVDLSDNERLEVLEERPNLPHIRPQRPYEDLELPHSLGVVPAPLAQYLREYQVEGTSFLHELFVYQKGGILGDDMGLGKTIQVIAFLTAAYGKTGDERDKKRMRKMSRKNLWYPKTLIVCPGSLMSNWQDELARWGWWHSDLYHGSTTDRNAVLDSAKSGRLEIMITTYTTYRLYKDAINAIMWDCVIADECHIIKERKSGITKSMNQVNSLCRIGLTGTAIQNKYEELWTLLNWCSPQTFGSHSEWKVKIGDPLKIGQSHEATVSELARARITAKSLVEDFLPPFFLRRMKTLIRDQLPKKTDRVVFCPLTPLQTEAYQNFLKSEIVEFIKTSTEPCCGRPPKKRGWCCYETLSNGDHWQQWVFPAIMYLQRLCNHIALLIPQSNDAKDKQEKDLQLLQTTLPDRWERLYKTRDSILNFTEPEFCGKWRVLKKLLKFWHDQADNNKVLVFSHSVRLLKMLQTLFISTKYSVSYLDGSMSYADRFETVQKFSADPSAFVFLISTRAGGVGLNITSANKVVVMDPNWNPSYDLQAQDRAYRIGQTRDVEVFRLVSQGTLEEIVYARQIYKQQQASIGYSASSERRYFTGVQDRKGQKGEIFGLNNIFSFHKENVVLKDIVNKTNIAEAKADLKIADLHVETGEGVPDETEHGETAGTNDSRELEAMEQLVSEITSQGSTKSKQKKKPFQTGLEEQPTKRTDPIQAILSLAGVPYFHNNDEVIGSSRTEAALSKRAAEDDFMDIGASRAFANLSQPQELQDNEIGEEGSAIRYQPPPDVKRRQFHLMSRWAGYDDVMDFALAVESWSQSKRRETLNQFYSWLRRDGRPQEQIAELLRNTVQCPLQSQKFDCKDESTEMSDEDDEDRDDEL